ncbi:MAG: 4-hydroxy-3-methylbut-2-enyl diphosphate reductase [Spirochaetes bacterium]|jgi:4-hydroxy-3-methylbut-2-enyl diphosphate reductase|nr:4-hydroxy-3-methylbut-2-enyl diphosphate reductase [Spirochaetota bacterium]
MKIKLAKTSGFCIGVKNAVLRIIKEINSTDENILIYGPLIHNPQTIDMLSARGLTTIKELKNIEDRPIAIRTHGIPLAEKKEIEKKSKRIINLTCPRVMKVQKIIEEHSSGGYFTIITGDEDHAEVIGLKSYAASGVIVISAMEDIKKIPPADRYVLVSQTTFDKFQFEIIRNELNRKIPGIRVFNTICSSTHDRQDEILKEIKNGVDAVVVIGGRDSANTKRLARICADNNMKTCHIETETELDKTEFIGVENVLVTAGASTPGWIINNVLEKLEIINTSGKNFFSRFIYRVSVFAVRTNIISSLGACFLGLFAQKYMGMKYSVRLALISALYVFAFLNISSLSEIEFIKKISPHKFDMLFKNRRAVLYLSLLSAAGYMVLIFQFTSITAVTGLITAALLLPQVRGLKKAGTALPASSTGRLSILDNLKNFSGTIGWAVTAAVIPLCARGGDFLFAAPVIIFIFSLIFMRDSILDIITFQGDLILGRKTVPVLFGAAKTRLILVFFSCAALLSLILASFLNKDMRIILFGLNILYYLIIILKIIDKEYLLPVKYETLAEINLLLFIMIFILIQI